MATFDIDKVRADLVGKLGGFHVSPDQFQDLRFGQNLRIVLDPKLRIQQWMPMGNARLPSVVVVGSAKSSGVGKLTADYQIVGLSPMLMMGLTEPFEQLLNA
jgi:hypothetical protein